MSAAHPPPVTARALRRNLGLDVTVAVSIGLTTTVAASLIPTVARQAGLIPIGLAVMSAAPFLGNLLGAFAGRLGPQAVRGYAVLRILSALLLVAVALAPNAGLIVVAVAAFQLGMSFASPFQTRLWGSMYPGDVRGRAIGIVGMARAAAAGIGAIAVGALADRLGVPFAVTLAGLVGAACAAAALGLRAGHPVPARRFSAHEAFGALTSRPELGRLALAQAFYGIGVIAALPLYALVYVDRLHLSLADVGTLAVLGGIAAMASYVAWGSLADRFGYASGLRLGAALGVVAIACAAVAPGIGIMALGSIAAGLSGAAMDVGIQGAMAHHTPLADRAAAMAGWNSVTGLRGVLAAMAAGILVQSGLVDVTTALVLCLVPTSFGVALYLGLPVPSVAAVRRLLSVSRTRVEPETAAP